jgi:hypothetical protein
LQELQLAHVSAAQALAARFTVKELRDAGQFMKKSFWLPPLL